MTTMTDRMNQILADWKAQFDVLSAVSFQFSIDEQDQLCFKKQPLHAAVNLVLTGADFDAESIQIDFEQGKSILISIAWPEEEPPRVQSVSFTVSV